MLVLSACSSNKDKVALNDNSKVLAIVEGKNITQQNVELARLSSTFSEREMLEKLIEDELLLVKAKELKINISDKEAKAEMLKQKDLIDKADNKNEAKAIINDFIKKLGITEEEYWNTYAIKGYKSVLIIGKTREKLGSDIEKTLKELRTKLKINYN